MGIPPAELILCIFLPRRRQGKWFDFDGRHFLFFVVARKTSLIRGGANLIFWRQNPGKPCGGSKIRGGEPDLRTARFFPSRSSNNSKTKNDVDDMMIVMTITITRTIIIIIIILTMRPMTRLLIMTLVMAIASGRREGGWSGVCWDIRRPLWGHQAARCECVSTVWRCLKFHIARLLFHITSPCSIAVLQLVSDFLVSAHLLNGVPIAPWTAPLPPPNRVFSAWGLPQKGLIFRYHFQSVLSATRCPYLAPTCRFESQNAAQSHPKSLQNWSPKPFFLQSADELDIPLFTIWNGPQAALHQLQTT